MSSYWKLSPTIGVKGKPDEVKWPAELQLQLKLDPYDFFEGKSDDKPNTVAALPAQLGIDLNRGTWRIIATPPVDPVALDINIDDGLMQIRGRTVSITATIKSHGHLVAFYDWVYTSFSQMLSLELGIFTCIDEMRGTIAGLQIQSYYPGGSYSIFMVEASAEQKQDILVRALELADPAAPSFPRFYLCTHYYQHALRLLSPRQVTFPPYVVFAEVILNLAKCIEQMFSSPDHEHIRSELKRCGYTSEQIEAHVIPILIIRNKIDVGHTLNEVANSEEIAILRKFVARAVKNIGALLRGVAKNIGQQGDFLAPLKVSARSRRQDFIKTLESYLEQDLMEPASKTQRVLSIPEILPYVSPFTILSEDGEA